MAERIEADVVVVGAGLAGLTAARRVAATGARAVVVEARDRVGGRLLNHDLGDGRVVEVGGQWIGPTQNRMYALASELGLEHYPTWTAGDDLLVLDGKEYRYGGGLPRLNPLALLDYGRVQSRLDRMAATVPLEAPWEAPDAAELDGQTLETWIRRHTATSAARRLLELGVGAVFATEARSMSLLHALFYVHSGGNLDRLLSTRGGAQQDRVVGGTQLFATRMAEALPDGDVHLSAPVRRVEEGDDGVVVDASRLVVRARYAVVAVPPALTARIDFVPQLPPSRAQLAQRMPHGSVIKCMAVYEAPWWRDDGLSGQAADPDGPVTVTFDNTPGPYADGADGVSAGDASGASGAGGEGRRAPGVLLAFVEGTHARRLGALEPEERRRAVLGSLVKLFGPRAADPTDYVDVDWSAEEWTRGCYGAHCPPGVLTEYGPALREPVGRVHWAGTETATHWTGYMDGAVESGERAAREVLDRLDRL